MGIAVVLPRNYGRESGQSQLHRGHRYSKSSAKRFFSRSERNAAAIRRNPLRRTIERSTPRARARLSAFREIPRGQKAAAPTFNRRDPGKTGESRATSDFRAIRVALAAVAVTVVPYRNEGERERRRFKRSDAPTNRDRASSNPVLIPI